MPVNKHDHDEIGSAKITFPKRSSADSLPVTRKPLTLFTCGILLNAYRDKLPPPPPPKTPAEARDKSQCQLPRKGTRILARPLDDPASHWPRPNSPLHSSNPIPTTTPSVRQSRTEPGGTNLSTSNSRWKLKSNPRLNPPPYSQHCTVAF